MRVHDSNLNAVTIGARQSGRVDTVQTGRASGYAQNGDGHQDRVSLSDLSSALSRVADDSPARTERVSQLAAAYRSGSYRVESSAVSERVVNDSIRLS